MEKVTKPIPNSSSNTTISIKKSNIFFMTIGVVALLGIGFMGGYLLREKQPVEENPQQVTQASPTNTQTELPNLPTHETEQEQRCNKQECLFKSGEDLVGFASLQGYYKKYDGTKWEWGNQQVSCDSLVTTGGSEKLINEFKKSIESGNTLNKIIDDELLININLSNLTSTEKALIEQSSPTNPVEIGVIRELQAGRGVSTCYSLFGIISVKSINK